MPISKITLPAVMLLVVMSTSVFAETIMKENCVVNLIDEARVAAQESGILEEVFAQDGQQVEAGKPLAKIDDVLAILQKNVSEAELKVAEKESKNYISIKYAKATADIAYREVVRHKEANDKIPGAIAESDVDKARLALTEAETYIDKAEFDLEIKATEVKVKKASLEAAEEHIKRRTITAPWSGAIDQVIRHKGDWVEPGDPILRLIRMDKLRVNCFLNAALYNPSDVNGKSVRVTARLARGEKATFEGTVIGISPLFDSENRFEVWAEVNNKKHRGYWILRPGMSADMEIQLGQ